MRDGFLGGNGVLTNGEGSGVYPDGKPETPPLEEFESPNVDVEIKDIEITAPDVNVYLSDTVSDTELTTGLIVKSGNVTLDMVNGSNNNYGLQSWQNAYVDIGALGLNNSDEGLVNDTTYTATVTISPNDLDGDAEPKTGTKSGNIYVFKPYITVTATDIWADYGVGVDLTALGLATKESAELAMTTEWKHGDTVAPADMGAAPAIESPAFTFAQVGSSDGTLSGATYTTGEQDADFNVTGMTCTVGTVAYTVPADALTVVQVGADDNHDFTIHINHFTMTITKKVDGDKVYYQDFIFDVVSETGEKFQVVIHGNGSKTVKGLVCGKKYDVIENGEWSWRYSAVNNTDVWEDVTFNSNPTVSNSKPTEGSKAVAVENKQDIFSWLSGNDFLNNRKSKANRRKKREED